jgi:hypothetical protein
VKQKDTEAHGSSFSSGGRCQNYLNDGVPGWLRFYNDKLLHLVYRGNNSISLMSYQSEGTWTRFIDYGAHLTTSGDRR